MDIFYMDGDYVPADKAALPVNDLAIIRGVGVFDFLKTHEGCPFLLDEHLQRLERSAREIDLAFPWSLEELGHIVKETLSRNDHPESGIRIVVTGGPSDDFITPLGRSRLLVLVTPLPPRNEAWYRDGVKIITVSAERNLPGAKSINYLTGAMATRRAREQDAVEAVYIDRHNYAREGTTSNIFGLFGNTLVTPSKNILPGITRQAVLDITARNFSQEMRDIRKDEFLQADELFITGSGKGLVPVINVDGIPIGDGTPGPGTKKIMELLADYVKLSCQEGQ